MDQEFVDRIYECSFVPERWPAVLEELSQIGGARGGSLFAANRDILRWTASERLRGDISEYVQEKWWVMGAQRRDRLFCAGHHGFLTDQDLYTPEEMEADPFYTEFLRPHGCGWAVATALPLPTGDNLVLHIERSFADGPVGRDFVRQLDNLRPHLARSAFMSARLQLERARAAGEALELLGLPALVMDEKGRALTANKLIETEAGFMRWRAGDHFSLADGGAQKLLREAIAAISASDAQPVRSFPIHNAEANAGRIAHLIPVRRSARDVFVRCAAVLVLTPVAVPSAPAVGLLQSLFDLTPAEARVARGLASGATIEEVATATGVSYNTVRTHLRGVMGKTGCGRQAEVVALLSGLSPFRV